MNRSFQNLPIKRKLMTVMMLTSSAALLLSCVGFVGYQLLSFIQDEKQNLATLGDVIAANSTAALSFRDQSSAEETLRGSEGRAEHPECLSVCAGWNTVCHLYPGWWQSILPGDGSARRFGNFRIQSPDAVAKCRV